MSYEHGQEILNTIRYLICINGYRAIHFDTQRDKQLNRQSVMVCASLGSKLQKCYPSNIKSNVHGPWRKKFTYLKEADVLSSSVLCFAVGVGESWPCSSWRTCLTSSPAPSSKGDPPLLPLLSPFDLVPLSDKTSDDGDVPCKITWHKMVCSLVRQNNLS